MMRLPLVLLISAIVATAVLAADLKVTTQYDKEFGFVGPQTYAWHPTGAGQVKMLITGAGDPEDIRRRLEPVIVQAVNEALQKTAFTQTSADQAAYLVNYYALIGMGTSAQEMGQFLPAVPEWGLPPIPSSTTSLTTYRTGTLILDISSTALHAVVWRGVAEAELDRLKSDAERQDRINEAVKKMLKKFPPKK